MATVTTTPQAAKGGSFLLESPQPSDVFTPADLTDDQKIDRAIGGRVRDEGSISARQRSGSEEARADARAGEKGRRTWFVERRDPRSVRRRGSGQSSDHGAHRKAFHLRRLCGNAWSARRNRNFANRLFRHRRTEEKISAQAGHRRNGLARIAFRSRRRARTRKTR